MAKRLNWNSIFEVVERSCKRYNEDSFRLQSELLRDLKAEGLPVESRKWNGWVDAGVVRSRRPPGGGYPGYEYAEIQKGFLAAYLYNIEEMRTEGIRVATSLWESGTVSQGRALSESDVNQVARARLILTGRILGVCGALAADLEAAPLDTIITLHMAGDDGCNHEYRAKPVDRSEMTELLRAKKCLMGYTSESLPDEVFPVMRDTKLIERRLGGREYYAIPIRDRVTKQCIAVTLGPRMNGDLAGKLHCMSRAGRRDEDSLPEADRQILELARYSFGNLLKLDQALVHKLSPANQLEEASLLEALMAAVLLQSPDRWTGAAFYAHSENDMLNLRAASTAYPREHFPSGYWLNEGRSPIRWSYQHQEHLVVNWPYAEDVRLSRELNRPGVSHAFVPAVQLRGCVGVLHVVGTRGGTSQLACFSKADLGVLLVLARVVGEAYQRNAVASVRDVCSVMPLRAARDLEEADLREALSKAVEEEVAGSHQYGAARSAAELYLAIFALRIRDMRNTEMQKVFLALVRQRANSWCRRYCTEKGRTPWPPAFGLGEEELAILATGLTETDVRQIRVELQEVLDDLGSINTAIRTDCAVWSVHLSYDYIQSNFNLADMGGPGWESNGKKPQIKEAVQDIVRRTRGALAVIWQVRGADAELRRRNFREAVNILSLAAALDRDNSYVQRHLAEAKFRLGEYAEAKKAAEKAIELDKGQNIRFASNHQRLAEAYFGLGEHEKALKEMDTACKLSQDLRYQETTIQFLVLRGNKDALDRAMSMIAKLMLPVGEDNARARARLEHLRGEACLRMGQMDQAVDAFEKAASLSDAYHDPNWDVLKARFGQRLQFAVGKRG